jgi:hypothetical protein
MQITDLNGYPITVTNLTLAIKQAAQFMEYRHTDNSFRQMDERLKVYWTDLHTKLVQLKDNIKQP